MSGLLKGRKYLLSTLALLLSAAVVICICFYALSVSSASASYMTVVLDAGHGGIDGGVSGRVTGVSESEINLDIVKKVQIYFERAGITCVLTRSTDAGLYGTLGKGFKKRDMQRRKEIIEEAKPVAVISVHQNFYSDSSKRGAHVFFRADSAQGKLLAAAVQKQLDALYNIDGRAALTGDYYILNCTDYPSIIAECGFLSSAEDEALLVQDDYRDKVAYAIFTGFIEYISVPSTS